MHASSNNNGERQEVCVQALAEVGAVCEPRKLKELRELEREVRKLRNETEEIHGQIRDLLWNEEENITSD